MKKKFLSSLAILVSLLLLAISCKDENNLEQNSPPEIFYQFTNTEVQLKYTGSVDQKGYLNLHLIVDKATGDNMIDTKRSFDIASFDYKLKMAHNLEEYAFELYTNRMDETNAAKVVNGLQGLIEKIYYEDGTEVFRDERLGGLFYLKAVFGAIIRVDGSVVKSNLRIPPVGEITPYQGYITGLTPFYAQEEMLLFIYPFKTYLNSNPPRLTQQDVSTIIITIPQTGQITYKQYFNLMSSKVLQGTDCGCCGNYQGVCYYANVWCYIHDHLCVIAST